MKQFSCGDVVPGCRRTFSEASEGDLFAVIAAHALDDHQISDLTPEIVTQVRRHITTV